MKARRFFKNRKRKKGFTLIECIVSIAIFAIMGTMFATFMVDSVRVVNLSVASDSDREAILEAIAAKQTDGEYTTQDGNNIVQIHTVNSAGQTLVLEMNFSEDVTLNGDYVTYTGAGGNQYSIYIGNFTTEGGGSDAP